MNAVLNFFQNKSLRHVRLKECGCQRGKPKRAVRQNRGSELPPSMFEGKQRFAQRAMQNCNIIQVPRRQPFKP